MTDTEYDLYAVYNTERSVILTQFNGTGVYDTREDAKQVRDNTAHDTSHLEVVGISRIEQ